MRFDRSRTRSHSVPLRQHRGFRHPPFGWPSNVPAVRGVRRCGDGDHACGARRRSHLEHPETDSAVSPRIRAEVPQFRARPADSWSRQEALEQAARGDVGDGVRAQGFWPEAMSTFSRSWDGPRHNTEFSRDDLMQAFSLGGISGGNAVSIRQTGLVQSAAHHAARAPTSSRAESSPHSKPRILARRLSWRASRVVLAVLDC